MSDRAITPRGINHLVLNVRDLEVSHKSGPRSSASATWPS